MDGRVEMEKRRWSSGRVGEDGEEVEEWVAGQKQLETHALRGTRRHFVPTCGRGCDFGLSIIVL